MLSETVVDDQVQGLSYSCVILQDHLLQYCGQFAVNYMLLNRNDE